MKIIQFLTALDAQILLSLEENVKIEVREKKASKAYQEALTEVREALQNSNLHKAIQLMKVGQYLSNKNIPDEIFWKVGSTLEDKHKLALMREQLITLLGKHPEKAFTKSQTAKRINEQEKIYQKRAESISANLEKYL